MPIFIPLQPPPLSFPIALHPGLGRRRSPSLLPHVGITGCERGQEAGGQGRGQQPLTSRSIKEQNAQRTNSRMAHEIKRRREEDDDMMPFVFPALYMLSNMTNSEKISRHISRLSSKERLEEILEGYQQQRHLQKKASPKSYNTQKKVSPKAQQSRASCNPRQEKALVDLLHEHNNPHYRCQNGWTSEAWTQDYRLLKEARKQSGASWDHQRCMIIADDVVWANIIQSNEKVRKFSKNKSFPLFDSLGELYDGQTAEGNMNFTSIEPSQHATLTQVNEYLDRSDSFPDVNWVADDDGDDVTTEVQDEDNATEHENQGSHINTTSRDNGEKNVKKTNLSQGKG
uniref:Myb/SANT-like domain-containing protein n=1 Tax=Oryza punctata TaxID=4537 RepID=A0A0E0MLK9_ORYPU